MEKKRHCNLKKLNGWRVDWLSLGSSLLYVERRDVIANCIDLKLRIVACGRREEKVGGGV